MFYATCTCGFADHHFLYNSLTDAETLGITDETPVPQLSGALLEQVTRIDTQTRFTDPTSQTAQTQQDAPGHDPETITVGDANPGSVESRPSRVHDLSDILVAIATVQGDNHCQTHTYF